jgi:hypothetical protein
MLARLTVGARALTGLPVPIPAFAVNGRSGVLLTGIVRPRLYVSRGILARLTAEELGMAVAHEVAHQRAWDNGKRWLIACAPDLLAFTRRGAELESRWRGSVERAADTAAAGRSRAAATTLASALVKVARFCAGHGAAVPSCSSFHEDDFLAGRIRVLLGESSPDCPTGARRIALRAVPSVMLLACLGGRAALQLVHAGTEWLVRLP